MTDAQLLLDRESAEPAPSLPEPAGWRWWEPRYELRLVRADDVPVLVWTRHRTRALARYSHRLEQAHLSVAPARLAVVDRRSGRQLAVRH